MILGAPRPCPMNASLPSYDLARLFHYSTPTTMDSGGEALIEAGAMEDSLHALVWQD